MVSSPLLIWARGQLPALVFAFVVLAGAGAVKWRAGLMPEDAFVPPPHAMPSPNAREYFTAAEALMRNRDDFINASEKHIFTLAQKKEFLSENGPAIARMREGLQYSYMAAPARSFPPDFRHFSDDVSMAHLLLLDGQTHAAGGDWGGAMSAYLDAIHLGTDLPRGATMEGFYIGLNCEAIGRKQAFEAVDHLSSHQAKVAEDRLARILANPVLPAQALREEKWFTQSALLKVFRDPSWRIGFLNLGGGPGAGREDGIFNFQLRRESARTAYDNCSRHFDAVITRAKLPWSQARLAPMPAQPNDPVNSVLLPDFDDIVPIQLGSMTEDRFLEIQLALRAYNLDHRSYPAELVDLVPTYLPAVPLDPFSDHQPLRYRREGRKYLLYSVGRDGADNGGRPVPTVTPLMRKYGLGNPNAPGDIVAGVNW